MLDDICPIQFIEGINEDLEPAKGQSLHVNTYDRVAIQYTPSLTFCLARLELLLYCRQVSVPEEYNFKLHTDYEDNPGKTVLREGAFKFDMTDRKIDWFEICLDHPVVIMASKNYWLDIESRDAIFRLCRTDKGITSKTSAQIGDTWSSGGEIPNRFMLRFYGRILPLSSMK